MTFLDNGKEFQAQSQDASFLGCYDLDEQTGP